MYENKPTDPLFVDDFLTPLSEAEATYYLREAYRDVIGEYPSVDSLALLWSQSALESARWKKIHANNWGNIKKVSGELYTSFECSEILNGKNQYFYPYHPQTFFGAWKTPLEGAIYYIRFLSKRTRYAKAWEEIKKGDPVQYCAELKKAGYFTADLDRYTKGVVKLTTEFKNKSDKLLAYKPEIKAEIKPEPEPEPILEPIPPIIVPEVSTPPETPSPPVETPTNSLLKIITAILKFFKLI